MATKEDREPLHKSKKTVNSGMYTVSCGLRKDTLLDLEDMAWSEHMQFADFTRYVIEIGLTTFKQRRLEEARKAKKEAK